VTMVPTGGLELVVGEHAASARDNCISIAHPTPSATIELQPSHFFRATPASNDRARIRMLWIALRGGRYGACALTSLAATEGA
jgi:hypothetical protein